MYKAVCDAINCCTQNCDMCKISACRPVCDKILTETPERAKYGYERIF